MQNPSRPSAMSTLATQSDTFAFCTACNNISASAQHACSWCGAVEVELLTLREISSLLRASILNQRHPAVAGAMPETRFRLSF